MDRLPCVSDRPGWQFWPGPGSAEIDPIFGRDRDVPGSNVRPGPAPGAWNGFSRTGTGNEILARTGAGISKLILFVGLFTLYAWLFDFRGLEFLGQ